MIRSSQHNYARGYLLILVIVFGAVFFTITSAFVGFVVTQSQVVNSKYEQQQALEISEAGLNYYRWFLAHFPNDVTNGTGAPGPYVHVYNDPEGGPIGEFSLDIASSTYCGDVASIDVWSTGYTYEDPSLQRTIYARYSLPTVTEYAYIINSNVWAGSDRTIIGPYHSNGIIRMDGTNNSVVTSGQSDWVCDGSLPCSPDPDGTTLDAVYGDGPNSSLWTFPEAPINFAGLTVDLSTMEDRAQNNGGIYIGPSGDGGYRLDFQSDNTVDVYVVDDTYSYYGYTSADGWEVERNVIDDDDYLTSYTIPTDCPLIFVEDKVWLEGDVASKVSVAAADNDLGDPDHSIILNGDITYATSTAGLLAVAEEDVLVGLVVPDTMDLNGIFIAQNGRFGRNHYKTSGWQDVLSIHNDYVTRDTLTMNGTIVSNGRVGTKWTSGGSFVSGYDTRFNSYDRDLVDDPPPLVPNTSDVYEFIEWREDG
ncbi:MAG: hypothetical protein AAGA35_03905 [Patescibacteria group bacterium]